MCYWQIGKPLKRVPQDAFNQDISLPLWAGLDFYMAEQWTANIELRIDDAPNSKSWSRATVQQSRLPQRTILFSLVTSTRRVLSSATKGKSSHGIDGHIQGIHGHVPCVSGVQSVPAWVHGGVQPCCVQTRGLQEAAGPAELTTNSKSSNVEIKHKIFYKQKIWFSPAGV